MGGALNPRIDKLVAVHASLQELATHADELARVSLPTLQGGVVDRTAAAQLVQRTLSSAEEAAELVATAGIGSAGVRDARTSVRMIEHAQLDEIALRDLGVRLRERAATLQESGPIADAYAEASGAGLLQRDVQSWSQAEWQLLDDSLRRGLPASIADLPLSIEGERPLAELVAAAAASGNAEPSTARYVDAWRVGRMDAAARDELAGAVLGRDPASLDTADVMTLRALHDVGASGTIASVSESLDGVRPFRIAIRDLAAGDESARTDVATYLDARSITARSVDEQRALLDELMGAHSSALEPAQWRTLSTLLAYGAPETTAQVPAELTDAKPILDIAGSIAAGKYAPGAATQRYFDTYQVARMEPADRVAAVDELLGRHSSELSSEQWRRFATLLDDPATSSALDIPLEIPGAKPLRDIARSIAAGKYAAGAATQRYFDTYQVARMEPADRVAAVGELLGRHSSELSSEQWRRFATLLDDPTTSSALDIPLEITGAKPLREIAHAIAAGKYPAGAATQRYFEKHAIATMGADARVAAARDLLAHPTADLTDAQWTRLANLLEDEPTASTIGLPQQLDGATRLADIAGDVTSKGGGPSASMRRYVEFSRLLEAPLEQRRDEIRSLMTSAPQELSSDQWHRLAALLEDEPTRTALGIPIELEGAKPLREIARSVAAGDYRPGAATSRYFEQYTLTTTPAEQLQQQARELFARGADELTSDEWTRLAMLVEHGPTRTALDVPAELAGAKPIATIARDIAASKYSPGAATHRYFDLMAVRAMSVDERVASATELLGRDAASSLSADEWRRLATLLDDEATASRLTTPLELSGAKPLAEIARSVAAGEYSPGAATQRYFAATAMQQMDPQERLDGARALLSKRVEELSDDEWGRLAALLDDSHVRDGIGIPTSLTGAKDLTEIAQSVAAGAYRPGAATQRYFSAYQLNQVPEAEHATWVAELFSRDADALATEDWQRLAAMLDNPSTKALVGLPDVIEGAKPLQSIATSIAAGTYGPGDATRKYFTAWRRMNDPQYQARLEVALAEVAAGRATVEARTLVAGEWDRLEQLVAGRPPAEQAAIAQVMMGIDSVSGSRSVRSTLELLRANMPDASDLPTELATVRAQTIELLDRNLSRLSGSTPEGAVRGYSNHPDYAEIGRIRSNLALIQGVQAEHAASTSAVAAADAVSSGTGANAAAAGDTIAW